MKKILFTLINFFFIFSFSQAQIQFSDMGFEAALKKAREEKKLVFMDVYATWCRPCKMLDANVFPDKELGKFFNDNFINLKMNGETPEGKKIMNTYNLTAFPSMIFVDGEGKLVKLVQGYRETADLMKQGQYALDPSTMPSYTLTKDYEKNPSREALKALILALNDDGMPIEERCKEYYKNYPDLDLKDQVEFYIFYLLENNVESPMFKKFMATASEFESKVITDKIESLLNHYLTLAVEAKDMQVVLKILDTVFPMYSDATEGAMSKDEIITILQEHFDGSINQE